MAYEAAGSKAGSEGLLSERLLTMLKREIALIEEDGKDNSPNSPRAKPQAAKGGSDDPGGVAAPARPAGRKAVGGTKERVEAIGQLTRTLEKLLELKRLERLARQGGEEADDAETAKLRAEMMKRLRAIDARRRSGPGLFGPGLLGSDAGGDAGETAPQPGQGRE